jgi:hypothetical protein
LVAAGIINGIDSLEIIGACFVDEGIFISDAEVCAVAVVTAFESFILGDDQSWWIKIKQEY